MNDNFLKIISATAGERRDLFLTAAARLGTTEQNIEKDFWVCWVLDALFHGLPPGGPRHLFKGGTSLSKAFGLISRFSEDIDITVFREDLGQAATVAQLEALSRKKRNARLDEIKLACQYYISAQLREILAGLISETAERSGLAAGQFRITLDEDDPDRQSLLVWYPTATPVEGYVHQAVKIESGAKSALDPNHETTIRPYLADDVASLNLDVAGITTVVAERTFWDKIIIIHGQRRWFERRGELQHQGQRVSRHYYDVYRLLASEVGQRALADAALSRDCVRHARMFFDRPDFDLASAVPGTRYAELATSSALDEVFSIDCQWLRAEVLVHLAPYLTGSLLLRAADAALKLEFERDHGYAVSALASRLVEEGEPNRALAFLETITYQLHLAEFLARSAGRLPPELLDCALALSRKLSFENDQKLALPVLFSELARRDRIEEAFEAVRQMKSQEVQSHVLCALATLLPSPLIAETIAIANRMERDDDRLRLLAAISTLALSSSQEDSVAGALESVIAGEREIYRHTDRLADAIGAMPMSMSKKVLAVLVRKLASDQETDAWAHSTKRGWRRMIDKLATLAGPEQLTGLVGIARRLNDRRSLERCVALLVIALAEAGYSEPALLVALELADQRCRSDALAGIAAHAPPNLLSHLRIHAQELPEEFERPQALAAVAKRLCSIGQHLEAMDVIRSAVWGMHREGVLSFMVRRLSSDLIPAAVELAKELHSPDGPKLLISLMAERPDVYSCQQIPLDRGVFLDILPPLIRP